MRADRLLRLVALLQRHRRVPAATLAQWLEVSPRTVLRDMEALSAAGVPVYTEQGRGGGCVLLEGFSTDASGLTTSEAQALFAWAARDRADDLGLGAALTGALAKIAASAPAGVVVQAEALGSVLLSDRRRWFTAGEKVPLLPRLREAAVAGRQVEIGYSRPGAGPTVRRLDPYGLVDNSGRWYLVAAQDGTTKSFRVDRITAVRVLPDPVRHPPDRPLQELWGQLRARWEANLDGDGVTLQVRVAPQIADRFLGIAGGQLVEGQAASPVGEPAEHRWLLPVRARRAGLALVLAWAPDVVLQGPPEMLEMTRRAIGELLRCYPAATADSSREDGVTS